jgi:hypothetical protein
MYNLLEYIRFCAWEKWCKRFNSVVRIENRAECVFRRKGKQCYTAGPVSTRRET